MRDLDATLARVERRRRRQTWLNTVMVLGLAAALAVVTLLLVQRSGTEHQVDELRQQAATNADAAEALAEQVRSLGQEPVVDVSELRGPRGKRGPGPTQAQVAQAVAAYCASGACTPPGPSPEQIRAAVAAYCADGRCRGGEGQPGQGPSQEQIAAVVAAYCAEHGDCRGEPGADGADGAPGRPPAGWSFTHDGTTYECTPDSPPEPGTSPHYTCRSVRQAEPPPEQPPPRRTDEPPPSQPPDDPPPSEPPSQPPGEPPSSRPQPPGDLLLGG